jgi:hypothetical protein
MHQQLWGYKVEEKLYVVVREQKRLNTTYSDHERPTVLWQRATPDILGWSAGRSGKIAISDT